MPAQRALSSNLEMYFRRFQSFWQGGFIIGKPPDFLFWLPAARGGAALEIRITLFLACLCVSPFPFFLACLCVSPFPFLLSFTLSP